jgi:hypothetical protein
VQIASVQSRVQPVAEARSGHGPGSAVAEVSVKSAKLFPDLFRDIDPDKRLRVLEIGRAQPETVRFFSDYKCRLRFADLYSDVKLFEGQAGATEAELAKNFRKTLAIPKGEKFDLCLLWDVMQYLSGRAIRALCGALEPHLHEGTRAHGFGVHSILTPCERAEYAIGNLGEFVMRKGSLPDLQYLPHPQAELSELLTVFKIERAILMGDGTVEMFLGSKPYWD